MEHTGAKRTAACYPSQDEINALPEKVQLYIHDLETRCDKSGDVQTIALLREDREALPRRMEELEARGRQAPRSMNPGPTTWARLAPGVVVTSLSSCKPDANGSRRLEGAFALRVSGRACPERQAPGTR
jgi:hypothetical protein